MKVWNRSAAGLGQGLFTLALVAGTTLVHVASATAQTVNRPDLVGMWIQTIWYSDGRPDSVHSIERILTLGGDSTWITGLRRDGGEDSKKDSWSPDDTLKTGHWYLVGDTLRFSDPAVPPIHAENKPFYQVARRGTQLILQPSWKPLGCTDTFALVDASKPLPPSPKPPARTLTSRSADLVGTWVASMSIARDKDEEIDTLTMRADSTWTEAHVTKDSLGTNRSYVSSSGKWTMYPGDILWLTFLDQKTRRYVTSNYFKITLQGQQLMRDRECGEAAWVYKRVP
jgi:hypothetical protein